MDEQSNEYFSSNVTDHEMNIIECLSDGGDEGEADDEEIGYIGEEDSEEAADEEDETIDSVSFSSDNFNGFKELEYPLDENSGQDISENVSKGNNDQEMLPTKTIVASVISISAGETKFSVKLKRCKGPEKVCCLCNLGEQSQLGQGKFYKIKKPESFVEERLPEIEKVRSVNLSKVKELTTGKHKKSASRQNLSLHEPVDEHSLIGHTGKVNVSDLFDEEGYIYIHLNCASFSRQISYNDNPNFENVYSGVSKSLTRLCSHCNRYGASVTCSFNNCDKTYHFPCSAASAGFQHLKTHSFICNTHIDHIPLLPTFNEVSCRMCFSLGDVSNLIMCSICGNHYHGICLGRALLPGVRTGWQCSECRSCQICHTSEESSKIMLCEVCDKAYHSACLRPAVTSIPKFGWKCQFCRICSDCGSRTPGSGFSSRWHRHFTVCDSCYQQRNKGFSCPLCHRAYRTGSSKEMAQCTSCKKFVHRTCDPEADPVVYQKKVETFPDYQYVCPTCKNLHQFGKITLKRKESLEDINVDVNMNTSHGLLTSDDMEIDLTTDKEDYRFSGGIGLGKGKPFTAKKKMAFSTVRGFKSKYNGKAAFCPPVYQKKNQKVVEFGRKKYTKTKMRGVFGAPSTGLQCPVTDSQTKSERECDEKKILLCSTMEEFVLSQDICVKCSALGTDQEGCLIACVQCGQCYHPYCADSNKVTKITKMMLQRGWKCIKCAVCEGCGKCDNESVLILCDDCNIAYHTYCVEPKLESVPEGSWKCKWCAHCLNCGANEPGVNSVWLKNYTECGPCASRVRCPSCHLLYSEGDLIIKCENCERWLHGVCDQIRSESDAEKCAIEGYSCLLCRPKDTQPPHLLIPPQASPTSTTSKLKIQPVSPVKVTECIAKEETEHFVDGTYLSESGLSHLTTILNRIDTNVFSLRKKKRTNNSEQGEQGILDSIESVIAGSESPSSSSAITYKEGMVIEPSEDGKPPEAPEGFNICTNESGIMILKKKRIRKIGVGGFNARIRTGKKDRAEDEEISFYNEEAFSRSIISTTDDKPRKKSRYRKPKSKYVESYPSYIQDAFFGRELLDTSKDTFQSLESSDSDSTELLPSRKITSAETVTLSPDELKIMEEVNAKREEIEKEARKREQEALKLASVKIKVEREEEGDKVDEQTDNNNEAFKDILNMSGSFLDPFIKENDQCSKTNTIVNNDANVLHETGISNYAGNTQKVEFTDILGPNFNLESMVHESGLPNMNSKDVEDIFKDVLTDDSQNSQDSVLPNANVNSVSSSTFPINQSAINPHPSLVNSLQLGVISQAPNAVVSAPHSGIINVPHARSAPPTPSQVLQSPQNIPSPATYPATSPYHSEYSNSPSQFSPAFSEPPSPWVQEDTPVADSVNVVTPSTTANQRTSQKMEIDEGLADKATISSVLYANLEHPELKLEFPVWSDRWKQILKKWRALPPDKKQPYLNQARENRTNMTRIRKSSKISMDEKTATESNSSLESEFQSDNTVNVKLISKLTNPETIPQVCQEDLLHPLLRVLSAEEFPLNSNKQTISVSSSPLQRPRTPEDQSLISTSSKTSLSFTNSEHVMNGVHNTDSSLSILNSGSNSNDTDFTVSQQTVTTTIPSHPSTIQYIPIIQTPINQPDSAPSVRAVHLISTSVPNQSNVTQVDKSSRTSTLRYQYVPAIQNNRNTIHYPPNDVQIIHSGPSLIANSNSLLTAALHSVTASDSNTSGNKFLHLVQSPSSQLGTQNQVVQNIQIMPLAPEEQCGGGAVTDQNIRVFTPSEIMKTLPPLGQEPFDVNSNTEQEKVVSTQKVKEYEQEKSWKQVQALRQQQMHDPRLQTVQRIQQHPSAQQQQQNQLRQITTNGADNINAVGAGSPVADNRVPLQIVTSADAMSSSLPSPGKPLKRFQSPVVKLPPASPVNQTYQRVQSQEVFTPPGTPIPQFYTHSQNTSIQTNNPMHQRNSTLVNSNTEMNQQLRELLQKQQMESIQTDQQHTQTRLWAQDSSNQQGLTDNSVIQNDLMNMPTSSNMQNQLFDNSQTVGSVSQPFRPPLPPRAQRLPSQITQQMLNKQRMAQQMMDPRFRIFMQQQQHHLIQQQQQRQQQLQQQQQQQQLQHQFQQQQQLHMQAQQSTQHVPFAVPNQIIQPSASPSQPKSSPSHEAELSQQAQNILTGNVRLDENNDPVDEVTSTNQPSETNPTTDRSDTQNEGLPESVTADLDELEKDGVFGDLMEDELLAEMGAGFNILEYADPELDNLTSGEKSNMLYDFVNGASDSTKAKEDGQSDNKNDAKDGNTTGEVKFSTNESNEIQMQIQQVENNFNESDSMSAEKSLQQRVLQLQRTNTRNSESPNSGSNQLKLHSSPSNSQGSLQSYASPMTPKPRSTVTPGAQSPLQKPLTPLSQDLMKQSPITGDISIQQSVITSAAPPPPPYPGPPPPYPSQSRQQIHHVSGSSAPNAIAVPGGAVSTQLVHHDQISAGMNQIQRRSLLLEEQPLLLEDLLEQEKREQGKQTGNNICGALPPLSDADFERLRADVLNSSGMNGSMQLLLSPHNQNIQPPLMSPGNLPQSNIKMRTSGNMYDVSQQQVWQQQSLASPNIQSNGISSIQIAGSSVPEPAHKIPIFNTAKLQPPHEPPENIVTDQDRQMQQAYEQWLDQQNSIVTQQLKHYEGEILKLRKTKKSLNGKQRVLRKQGNELTERDNTELQKVTQEMAGLQKYLDNSRKMYKQHMAIIQEYKSKHPNSAYSLNDIGPPASTSSISAPVNVVSSVDSTVGEIPSSVSVISTQQKVPVVVANAMSRANPTNIAQTQPNEMQFGTGLNERGTSSTTVQSPTVVSSQARPNVRGQEPALQYSGGPAVLFSPPTRQQRPNVLAFQVQTDGTRQTGVFQNPRGSFKTQPFVVSTGSASPSPNAPTVVSSMSSGFQNVTGQQLTPDQQQILIHRQQLVQRSVMLQQPNLDPRQKRILQQRQNLISQIQAIQQQLNNANLSPKMKQTLLQQKDALIKQGKELQQQIELTPQQKQLLAVQRQQMLQGQLQQQQQQQRQHLQQKQNISMNQVLAASQQASIQQKHIPSQSPVNQQLNQLLNQSPESNQHQFNQSLNSPIQPPSPQHFSQPPCSPMYQPQHTPSPGNANYSHMHSGPPSVQSHYNQPASPMPPQSPRHASQFVHPSSSPAHPQSPFTSHDSDNAGGSSGGGGNTMSFVNAIPVPEEFRRLGIKPGLLGGSPAWSKIKKTRILAHEFEKYGIKSGLLGGTPTWNEKQEEDDVETIKNPEKNASVVDDEVKACTSRSAVSSSQFYPMEEDIGSSDSLGFFSLPDKAMKTKSPSTESPNDFENAEFHGCDTPKTSDDSIELPVYKDVPLIEGCKNEEMNASDDSMELPMYKDVRLIEGCKSEEDSLCFPATIEDNEISLPLDMDSSGLHLALDSGDVRSDDLLDGCLVSSDLLVLNVSEDQEIIDETKYASDIVVSTPLRTTSVVQTTTTISTTSNNNFSAEKLSSCEEANTVNHSIVSTHAFHSYAKIIKSENGENSVEHREESDGEIESDEKIEPKNTEELKEPKKEPNEGDDMPSSIEISNAVVTTVVTSIPTRTTTVLQMTPSALQSSTTKEAIDGNVQPPPPVYTENFHSYVKKLPKNTEEDTLKGDILEKDEQLFDETVIKIKTENISTESQEEEQLDGENEEEKVEEGVEDKDEEEKVSNKIQPLSEVTTTTTTAQYCGTNSVIIKDVKLASMTHSTGLNQSKESTEVMSSKPPQVTGNMFPPRVRANDDSQNVLLKQLLQNSGSNSSITHSTMTQHVTKPPPSPSYKSPPVATTSEVPVSALTTEAVIAQVSEPQPKTESPIQYTSVQRAIPTTVIKQEINVPSTSVRKEVTTVVPPTQTATSTSSTMSPMHIEIKKEVVSDEIVSPQFKASDVPDTPNSVSGDSSTGSILDAQDLKKLKRRQYQAKRRQSQSKDNTAVPKKRNRKVSKVEEDYDTFVDNLMKGIRQLPRIEITEPLLIHNYAVCLPYGAGDGTKISLKSWVNGELTGTFGSLRVPKHNDFYNTEPFGDEIPIPQPAISPPTRDFYNVELPPLNLEAAYEERRLELARLDREVDTPHSVISSSSPECIIPHTPSRFAGLRLIDENGSGVDSEEDEKLLKRISPVIPLVVPLALRPKVQYQDEAFIQDKENYGKSATFSSKPRNPPGIPLKDKANLSVTLTLSSQAAQDIVGVLKNLATVLNIAPPVSYKIPDRIQTPSKINPFGGEFSDDIKEVELEKYLGSSMKHCQHCKTPISDYSSVKKKASEVPFIVQDGISEDLLFCSTSCYLQMILLVPPVISEHKVSSSDDHTEATPRKKMRLEKLNDADISAVSQVYKITDANSGKDIEYVEKTSLTPESTTKTDPTANKKQLKGIRYRTWNIDSIPPPVQKYKTPTEKEITETLFRMNITVMPTKMPEDMRSCIFCQQSGDGVANGPSRLLNYDVDKWAHLNCSLWSDGVYETQNGALMNVDTALKQGLDVTCTYCKRNGATLKCFKLRCSKVYHLSCAMKSGCCFLENKTVFCEEHLSKAEINRVLTTLAVYRRVYIDRDENRQIASVIKHAELTHLMRIGSLVFLNVGSLLPHQLPEFHTSNFIYPVGYKVIRFYWSMRIFNKRCQYVCSIHDVAGRPEFRVLVQESGQDDLELRGSSPNAVWTRILEPLANLRKINNSVQLFPCYVTGEYLFGLTEPAIVRILENLPGIETLSDYTFKFGRDPLLELPLAVNPSGCARCEPRVRGPPLKRTHTQRTSSIMPRPVLTSSPLFSGDLSCPYSKHFVHSKSSQYKKMKQEWRNYVYLARSKIQGLGLYAARDIDKHTMVIEYIGEIIRSQLSDFREKQYEAKNRGVYMFRLDENRVVDATISGGLARYINHSCNPNCITEKVEVDREFRIIIFSKRRIVRGEELSYDYQFDIEDDMHKIPCLCGASNCRKWMN